MSISDEIATIIQTAGYGTPATDLFVDRLPDTPDTATSVTIYGGFAPESTQELAISIEYATIQVMTRALSSAVAYNLAYNIYRALARIINRNGFLKITPNSMPFLVGRDANERTMYSCNFTAMRGAP